MNEKKKFETTDLVKLGILLVLLLVAVIVIWRSGQQTELAQEISPTEGEITEIEAKAATQIAMEELETGTEVSQGSELPADEVGDLGFPEIPENNQELLLVVDEGVLIDVKGMIVYVLSEDGQSWMPAVPVEISENTNEEAPLMDIDGNWVLVGENGEIAYIWDSQNMIWVSAPVGEIVVEDLDSETEQSPEDGDTTESGEAEPKDSNLPDETGSKAGEESSDSTTGEPEDSSNVDATEGTSDSEGAGSSTEEQATDTGAGSEASESSNEATSKDITEQVYVTDIPESIQQVPKTYAIERGEFVYCISRRFNVNPVDVLRLNGLRYYSVLHPGMVLRIPPTGHFPTNRALKPHPAEYTVIAGDSVNMIACKFGDVFPEAIIYANNIEPPYSLTPGQTLYIP